MPSSPCTAGEVGEARMIFELAILECGGTGDTTTRAITYEPNCLQGSDTFEWYVRGAYRGEREDALPRHLGDCLGGGHMLRKGNR